jgi:prepilin signal peptidase PulO-like enzyme (type II secretory pathway)
MMVAYVAFFLAGIVVGSVAVIGVITLISFAISWVAQKEAETFATTADRIDSQ